MRLTLVISSMAAGGAERVMATLANDWVSLDHDVTLVMLSGRDVVSYTLDARIKRVGLDLLASTGANPLGANIARVRRLREAIARSSPDVVVSFMDRMNVRVLIATVGMRCAVIVSERIDPRSAPIGGVWSGLRAVLYRWRARALVVQTESTSAWARALVGDRRTVVIPNPVNEVFVRHPITEARQRGRRIVAMGRLVHQKGFDILLSAFQRLASDFPQWSLVIVGAGPLEQELRDRASAMACAARIEFAGLTTAPERWFASAGVFVLPSRFEGFPNVLVEAMTCGCACVAADCPSGPAEIVDHGVNGFLVPVGDVEALTRTLQALLRDSDLRARVGAAAAAGARRYRLEHVRSRWTTLLRQVREDRGETVELTAS